MDSDNKQSYRMKIFQKGQVVIPAKLRKKYKLEAGDRVEIRPTPDGILLRATPQKTFRKERTHCLFGIFKDAAGRAKLSRKAMAEATEKGFSERWKK